MAGFLKSLFTTPERDGRRLYNDAVSVIDADQKSCSAIHLQRSAELARNALAEYDQRLGASPKNQEVLTYDIQQQHRNARQCRDYAKFSALTLVLIHLQAKQLGTPGQSAIEVIDDFLTNTKKPDMNGDNSDGDVAQERPKMDEYT